MKLTHNQYFGKLNELPFNLPEGSTYIVTDDAISSIYVYGKDETPSLISGNSQISKVGNYNLEAAHISKTIFTNGGITTINPNLEPYGNKYEVYLKNTADTNGSISCIASTGWTYSVNGATAVASGTFVFTAGKNATVIRELAIKKIYLDGGLV